MKKISGWLLVFGAICSALGFLFNNLMESETEKKIP